MSSLEGFRLSAQQRDAWTALQSDPSNRPWCALRIDGAFDASRLLRAAEELVAAHEILRTTYHRGPGMRFPLQVVAPTGSVAWVEDELSGENEPATAEPDEAVARLVARERAVSRPFDQAPALALRVGAPSGGTRVVLVSLPALAADRRTLHEMALQLAGRYAGTPGGGAAGEAIQYADYSQWQEDLWKAADGTPEAASSYWRAEGARGGPTVLPFQGESGPGAHGGGAGGSEFILEGETIEMIDALARDRGFTDGEFLLACWQALLSRLTGEAEIVVDAVEEARGLEDLGHALGAFARALPVGARFEGDATVAEAARADGASRARNEQWQEYFGSTADGEPASPRARKPGFEFFRLPGLPSARGTAFSILSEFVPRASAPLHVSCERRGAGVRVRIDCEADARCADGTAARLASYLERLVSAAARHPDAPAGTLPILSEEETRTLTDWSRGPEAPPAALVHELFEERARRFPDAPALVCGATRLTYGELDRRANAIAWRLRERGVGPDVPVGLAVDRSADAIVAVLGILKAGGGYVPLNPEHPGPRLELQLSGSGCRILLTHAKWLEKVAGFAGETICMDGGPSDAGREDDPPRAATPSSLAYVMHTSGSTGAAKGVAVPHSSLANYANAIVAGVLGLGQGASPALAFAAVSTIAADLGNTAIFPALISGGCLHLVEYETAMDGGRFAEYAARHPIDVMKIVPSHFSALLDSGGGAAVVPRRFLILGGEALSWDLVDRVRSLSAACRIVNHYGPTETTVGSLTHSVSGTGARPPSRTVPIGRPIANTEVFILDPWRQPVPAGVAGEIYIGGAGLSRGYVNQPDETAEKFVPHPFPASNGGRLYRTGDRARHLPGGDVEFLGRLDDQAKIRGFRIEPGEVRSVLAAHAKVRECFVLVRKDLPGDPRLVAYVVAARGATISADELRAWARSQLPEYMVPTAFVAMRSLPLTANGKVDRLALPPPEQGAGELYVAPRTARENTVAEIWKEVLKVDRVGARDNFFDLGGHSLLLTQVVSRLRRTFERDLPIRWLFESPTVEGLAGRIDAAEREELGRILDEIEALPDEGSDRLEKLRE
ncbi:MAG: amino acid adenylation domain-containing protein [Acidobacteriota bacterium]